MSIFESGDIWSSAAFSDFESPLKDLLDSGEYTLVDLLDQNELLQELKASENEGLLFDFFTNTENLMDLLSAIRGRSSSSTCNRSRNTIEGFDDTDARYRGVNDATTTNDLHPVEGSSSPILSSAEEEEKEETDDDEEDATMGYEITENDKPMTSESSIPFAPREKSDGNIHVIMDDDDDHNDKDAENNDNGEHESSAADRILNQTIRHPYMACEIICCECPPIIHTICHDTKLLDCLFRILDIEVGTLDDRTAGYFEKILTVLIRHQASLITAYIDAAGVDLLQKLLDHIGSFSIAQILQRLLMPCPPTLFDFTEDTNSQQSDDDDDDDDDDGHIIDAAGGNDNQQLLLRCRWSGNVEAIGMLLQQKLISDDVDGEVATHASDLLVSLVQQSPLDSELLMAFTSAPFLDNIVDKAIRIPLSEFIPYDTPATCAVQLLEALVLQLGGYGCVAPLDESITYLLGLSSAADDDVDEEEEDPSPSLPSSSSDNNVDEDDGNTNGTSDKKESAAMTTTTTMNTMNGHHHQHHDHPHGKDEPETDASNSTNATNTNTIEPMQQNATANSGRKRIATPTHLKSLVPTCLKPLKDMLQIDEPTRNNNNHKNKKSTTWQIAAQMGRRHRLLGAARLRIVRFVESLVLLSQPDLDLMLIESGILEVALDLFLKFEWCSMLHQSVANLLVHVIEGGDNRKTLQTYLIHSTDLLQKLLEAYDRNEEICIEAEDPFSTSKSQFRLGYMGHIIIICQAIEHACCSTNSNTESKAEEHLNEEEEGIAEIVHEKDKEDTVSNSETSPSTSEPALHQHHSSSTTITTSHLAQTILESEVNTKWREFTRTQLAEITTIQSTPLGGGNANASNNVISRCFDNGIAINTLDSNLHVDDTDLDVAMGMMGELNLGDGINVTIEEDADCPVAVVSKTMQMNGGNGMYAFDENPLGTQKENDLLINGGGDDDDSSSDEEDEATDDDDDLGGKDDGVPTMDLFVSASTSSSEEDWTANFADAFGDTSARLEEAAPDTNTNVVERFEADFAAFDMDDNKKNMLEDNKDYVGDDDIIMGAKAKGTKNEGGECEEEDVFLSSSSSGSSVDDILFG
eukprot:CAMPEP_0196806908 /NCGR_PEP_ID=MMETSP1362-20130617/6840_1 /TAXON_ID=163516 /ORGANISM="Leptocylindrus danicus, Strain CCMP1856" /LENGTH=1088 /DNA_ID=CAMNT_0042180597 /DNA_START=145 /DNA_END=3411 /DNA_ORIENTATION=+